MKATQEIAQQKPCEECKYYFGKNEIHCALHPYGKETEYCNDWQQKHIDLEQENIIANNLEAVNSLYRRAVCILVNIASIILLGNELANIDQSISDTNSAYKNYDVYIQECDIFLERAGNAGTSGVAEKELAKAVKWLEDNYSTQAFEYKNLKANLNYLKKQPENLLLPIIIKNTINSSKNVIKNEELKIREGNTINILAILIAMVGTAFLITTIIVFYKEEGYR